MRDFERRKKERKEEFSRKEENGKKKELTAHIIPKWWSWVDLLCQESNWENEEAEAVEEEEEEPPEKRRKAAKEEVPSDWLGSCEKWSREIMEEWSTKWSTRTKVQFSFWLRKGEREVEGQTDRQDKVKAICQGEKYSNKYCWDTMVRTGEGQSNRHT